MDLEVYGHTEDDTEEEGGMMKRVKGHKRTSAICYFMPSISFWEVSLHNR